MQGMELLKTAPALVRRKSRGIRLMILHDHLLFRETLARLLALETDFEPLAKYGTSSEALKGLKRSSPHVVLVNIGIAKEFIFCARKIRHAGKYLVLAGDTDQATSAEMFKFGASGIFQASDSPNRLMQAIRLVAGGEAWVDQKMVQLLAERYPLVDARWPGKFTERERAVLQGVMDGLSNRKIGHQIGVSESTIKAALQHLFKKSGVRTRSQLVRIALEGAPVS